MIFVRNNGSSSYPYVIPSEYTVIYPMELRILVLLKQTFVLSVFILTRFHCISPCCCIRPPKCPCGTDKPGDLSAGFYGISSLERCNCALLELVFKLEPHSCKLHYSLNIYVDLCAVKEQNSCLEVPRYQFQRNCPRYGSNVQVERSGPERRVEWSIELPLKIKILIKIAYGYM